MHILYEVGICVMKSGRQCLVYTRRVIMKQQLLAYSWIETSLILS